MAYPVWSQRDPRWKYLTIGYIYVNGKKVYLTMGTHGCMTTCCAMIAKNHGKVTDPGKLCRALKAIGGYTKDGLLLWSKFTQIYPDIKMVRTVNCKDTAAPIKDINSSLSVGVPVIAHVDASYAKPGLQTHFITLWKSKIVGNVQDYLMTDPWYGDQIMFRARYKSPSRYIYGVRFFKIS